jgi:hypothetical protein
MFGSDHLVVRHVQVVGYCRPPGRAPLPRSAPVRRNRMLMWSALVVSLLATHLGDRLLRSSLHPRCPPAAFPGQSRFAQCLATARCLWFSPRSGTRLARGGLCVPNCRHVQVHTHVRRLLGEMSAGPRLVRGAQLTRSMRTIGTDDDLCGGGSGYGRVEDRDSPESAGAPSARRAAGCGLML